MADQEHASQIIAGRNPVREALERRDARLEKILIRKGGGGQALEDIRRRAEQAGLQVQFIPAGRLDEIARGSTHQGVAAVMSPIAYRNLEDMLASIAGTREEVQERKPLLVLLDQVSDPHNYGAIVRSAAAAGAAGVVVPQHGMAPLSAVAVKASAGTALTLPIAQVTNLADAILQLKERGYWIAGMAGGGETSIWEMNWDLPLAIVIGSEGKGIRPRVLSECDYVLSIPIRGDVESLNASVAAGIVLFAAVRERD